MRFQYISEEGRTETSPVIVGSCSQVWVEFPVIASQLIGDFVSLCSCVFHAFSAIDYGSELVCSRDRILLDIRKDVVSEGYSLKSLTPV